MGREGENLPLARASRPSAADAGKASGAALGGLLGRSIVVRERKGSRPWCSLCVDRPPGEGIDASRLSRALGAPLVCHVAHVLTGPYWVRLPAKLPAEAIGA